ncbi:iron-regulated transporter [Penicillium brevicompactum]|uniref:Solute carrier family 40 member n=1 Tax=Penicillium brevicompactum TaxID=5074 RepID=A0A9W9UCW7_PENBR|nr:iron-regulated transporter [Penicillium brevicompactum]
MAILPEHHPSPESDPLLHDNRDIAAPGSTCQTGEIEPRDEVSKELANRLYLSHFLSTWNSRVFEFGAVLYLATIYPGTLLPMSVYALSRGLAAIILASAVGHFIDVTNRLKVVRLSIVLQRLAVAASCAIFYLLKVSTQMPRGLNISLLVALACLACVEKLCSIMNLVAVERDWVVVVAGNNHEICAHLVALKTCLLIALCVLAMNAQMRRIDLVCKLIGPLFIASMDVISTDTAILVNFGMNVCSVVVEYHSIAKVYYMVPGLRESKQPVDPNPSRDDVEPHGLKARIWKPCQAITRKSAQDLVSYIGHPVFLPSFAGALLYLTVLSFSGQMVTWLLSAGYDSALIAATRAISVACEFLATWIAPWLMGRIGTTRAGLWLASWQIACLVAGMTVFWEFFDFPLISASGIVGGTILSRIGLRGFDLCAQIIVQEGVDANTRGSFSSTEAAWQNLFEICSYVATIIFSRPDQFQWPVLISVIAVTLAGVLYASFVRIQRGHLVHMPKCLAADSLRGPRYYGWDRIVSSDF